MRDIVLIGGGGHCKSCINLIEELGEFNIIGVLDSAEKIDTKVLKYRIIGTDETIQEYFIKNTSFCVSIGQIDAENEVRCRLFNILESLGADIPVIISPTAKISKYSFIKKGTIIFSSVIVNADSKIGENCIINNMALIEHDVVIGQNCHISTGTVINGNCNIGNNCMIGSSAVIRNGISIAPKTMIGMGTIVTKSITEPGVYYGNPARRLSI